MIRQIKTIRKLLIGALNTACTLIRNENIIVLLSISDFYKKEAVQNYRIAF